MLAILLAAALTATPLDPGARGGATAAGTAGDRAGRTLVAATSRGKPRAKPRPRARVRPRRSEPARAAQPSAAAPKLPEPRPLPTAYRAVAVLPLAGIDVGFETVHDVEIALLREVDETQGMRAITPGDVRADDATAGLDPEQCAGDVTCLARAGRHAGAHLALDTRLAALGGTLNVSLRLIDTQAGKELGRVAEPLSEDEATRATELHRYAVQLFAPDTYVGSLRIKCSQEGADVYLDDKLVGATPMAEPLKALRAGPHILHVTKAGFSDLYQFVDVVYNRSSTVEVDLSNTAVLGVMVEAESQTGLGSLFVEAAEPGVEIRADGEPQGVTPLAGPIGGIPAGKRRISLRKEGLEPLVREVEIEAGKRTDLVVRREGAGLAVARIDVVDESSALPSGALAAASSTSTAQLLALGSAPLPPFQPTWRTWGGAGSAGLGALLVAVGGLASWRMHALDSEEQKLVAGLQSLGSGVYSCSDLSREECAARAARLDELAGSASTARTLQALGFLGGGLAILAGGGLFAWDYYGRPGAATAPSSTPPLVTVAPLAGGATLGVAGTF